MYRSLEALPSRVLALMCFSQKLLLVVFRPNSLNLSQLTGASLDLVVLGSMGQSQLEGVHWVCSCILSSWHDYIGDLVDYNSVQSLSKTDLYWRIYLPSNIVVAWSKWLRNDAHLKARTTPNMHHRATVVPHTNSCGLKVESRKSYEVLILACILTYICFAFYTCQFIWPFNSDVLSVWQVPLCFAYCTAAAHQVHPKIARIHGRQTICERYCSVNG